LPIALEHMMALCNKFPQEARCLYHSNKMRSILQNAPMESQELWQVLELNPNHEEAFDALIRNLVHGEAIDDLLRLDLKYPNRPEVLMAALYVARKAEDKSQISQIAEILDSRFPSNLKVAFRLFSQAGTVHRDNAAETILSYFPQANSLRFKLATSYFEQGQYGRALDHDRILAGKKDSYLPSWRAAISGLMLHSIHQ